MCSKENVKRRICLLYVCMMWYLEGHMTVKKKNPTDTELLFSQRQGHMQLNSEPANSQANKSTKS